MLISIRLNNDIFANKDKVDKDKLNKNKAKSYIIIGLVILELQVSSFLA